MHQKLLLELYDKDEKGKPCGYYSLKFSELMEMKGFFLFCSFLSPSTFLWGVHFKYDLTPLTPFFSSKDVHGEFNLEGAGNCSIIFRALLQTVKPGRLPPISLEEVLFLLFPFVFLVSLFTKKNRQQKWREKKVEKFLKFLKKNRA